MCHGYDVIILGSFVDKGNSKRHAVECCHDRRLKVIIFLKTNNYLMQKPLGLHKVLFIALSVFHHCFILYQFMVSLRETRSEASVTALCFKVSACSRIRLLLPEWLPHRTPHRKQSVLNINKQGWEKSGEKKRQSGQTSDPWACIFVSLFRSVPLGACVSHSSCSVLHADITVSFTWNIYRTLGNWLS